MFICVLSSAKEKVRPLQPVPNYMQHVAALPGGRAEALDHGRHVLRIRELADRCLLPVERDVDVHDGRVCRSEAGGLAHQATLEPSADLKLGSK